MRTQLHIVLILLASLLASCVRTNQADRVDITFASTMQEEIKQTKAGGDTPLARNFVVWGYKIVNTDVQSVFPGYTVRYVAGSAGTSEDNSHDYEYVGVMNGIDQTIKFWDFGADEYHFWGVSALPGANYSFSGDARNILTISDMYLRAGGADPDDVFYSTLSERRPVSAEVVQMQFKRPYAKVRIQFYTNEPINDSRDNVTIEDITFGPDPDVVSPLVNRIYGKGDVKITYPQVSASCPGNVEEVFELEHLTEAQEVLHFDNITLTSTQGLSSNNAVTAPVTTSIDPDDNSFYYLLPMGEKNPAFTMTAKIDADIEDTTRPDTDPIQRTAVVPANFMQWKPNFCYTYIFKITAGANIEFYDVKIAPWKFGGYQEEDDWKNW